MSKKKMSPGEKLGEMVRNDILARLMGASPESIEFRGLSSEWPKGKSKPDPKK